MEALEGPLIDMHGMHHEQQHSSPSFWIFIIATNDEAVCDELFCALSLSLYEDYQQPAEVVSYEHHARTMCFRNVKTQVLRENYRCSPP